MGKEIEGKYLLKNMKEAKDFLKVAGVVKNIEQYYTDITDTKELRYRKELFMHSDTCYKTEKVGIGLEREENEVVISIEEYEENKVNKVGNTINKLRYVIPIRKFLFSFVLEYDYYLDDLEGLEVVEVEFKSRFMYHLFNKYLKPKYFGKEITKDKKYKNKNIAKNGLKVEV